MPRTVTLIIGAMKCGTSSLFYYLSEHPQIAQSREKELHFFSRDHEYEKGLNWYFRQWAPGPGQDVALEASPSYTMAPYTPDVPERIAHAARTTGLTFKFIYIVRHPLARIESHIAHRLAGSELAGRQKTVEEQKWDEENFALTRYASQLDPYVARFGREAVHVAFLEELQASPHEVLQRACRFLEINETFRFTSVDVVRNTRQTVNLHPAINKLRHVPVLRSVIGRTSPRFRQWLRQYLVRRDPYEVHFTEDERREVLGRLHDDLRRFRDDHGLNLEQAWHDLKL